MKVRVLTADNKQIWAANGDKAWIRSRMYNGLHYIVHVMVDDHTYEWPAPLDVFIDDEHYTVGVLGDVSRMLRPDEIRIYECDDGKGRDFVPVRS